MDEAEYLADRITVLSAGHIVAEGTPQTLGGRDHMTTAISFTLPDHVQAHDLPPGLSPLTEPGPGGSTVLHSESPLVHLQMLGNWALGRGFDLHDLDVQSPTLEEVYLSLTGPASRRISDDQDGPAPVRLRPACLSPQPPVAVLHPGPAGAFPGDLRVGVRRQREHHPGRRRPDQHVGVLRARHHRTRGYRGVLPLLSSKVSVSGHVYDIATGRVTTTVDARYP
jgi:hypothetical protein